MSTWEAILTAWKNDAHQHLGLYLLGAFVFGLMTGIKGQRWLSKMDQDRKDLERKIVESADAYLEDSKERPL